MYFQDIYLSEVKIFLNTKLKSILSIVFQVFTFICQISLWGSILNLIEFLQQTYPCPRVRVLMDDLQIQQYIESQHGYEYLFSVHTPSIFSSHMAIKGDGTKTEQVFREKIGPCVLLCKTFSKNFAQRPSRGASNTFRLLMVCLTALKGAKEVQKYLQMRNKEG